MIVRNNEGASAKRDLCDRCAPRGRFIQTFLGCIHKKQVSSPASPGHPPLTRTSLILTKSLFVDIRFHTRAFKVFDQKDHYIANYDDTLTRKSDTVIASTVNYSRLPSNRSTTFNRSREICPQSILRRHSNTGTQP